MSHDTVKEAYKKLVDRLNRFPQGAPPSELLFKILTMLFSEKEAEYVSLLPHKTVYGKESRENLAKATWRNLKKSWIPLPAAEFWWMWKRTPNPYTRFLHPWPVSLNFL